MKISSRLCIAALTLLVCACDDYCPETGMGRGSLLLKLSNGENYFTKALVESQYANTDNYDVVVTNNNGREVLRCKGADLDSSTPKELEMGNYDIVASYGSESPASRDNFYVEGTASIVLQPNQVVPVTLVCAPTCGKVFVNFSSEMATYYSDYYVEYRGTEALGANSIKFAKGDSDPWYIKLKSEGETVNYVLHLTVKDEYQQKDASGNVQKQAQVSGSFNLNRNKAHMLTVKPNYTPQSDGAMGLTIVIDESTEDREVDIEIPVSWV